MDKITCPSNTYLCMNDIDNINGNTVYGINTIFNNLKETQKGIDTSKCSNIFRTYVDKNNKQQTITECDKNPNSDGVVPKQCNNCDYLFENLIKGNTSCKELFKGLENMTPEQLKEQIKYNLTQVVRMRVKSQPSQVVGTFGWWKENIWGINKIQNYIYIVSFAIAFFMVVYFIYNILVKASVFEGMILLGTAITFCVLIMYYAFSPIKYQPPNVDPRLAEQDKDSYNENVSNNWKGERDVRRSVIVIIPAIIIGLAILVFALVKGGAISSKNILVGIVVYILAGFIIALNMYYAFLIPQLLILGIILQKMLLSELTPLSIVDNIFKGIILLILTGLSLVYMGMNIGENNVSDDKCTGEKITSDNYFTTYYLLLPISLVILTLVYGIDPDLMGEFKDTSWGLFLEPFGYLLTENI